MKSYVKYKFHPLKHTIYYNILACSRSQYIRKNLPLCFSTNNTFCNTFEGAWFYWAALSPTYCKLPMKDDFMHARLGPFIMSSEKNNEC